LTQTVLVARPDDVRAFGRNAAALIGQIEFWTAKAASGHPCVIRRDGYVWVAKSREEWCSELILSLKQFKSALAKLVRMGVVVSERHLHKNRVTAHFRVDSEARDRALEGPTNEALEGPNDWSPEGPNIYSEKEEEKENSAGSAAPTSEGPEMPSKVYGVQDMLAGKGRTSKVSTDPDKASKPNALAGVFKAAWSDSYPDEFMPSLTHKQLGQLKLFAQSCPQGTAGKVLDWCVRNWSIFTSQAEAKQGAFKSPERPTVGYLLQYLQTAVNAHKDSTQAPQVTKVKVPAPIPHPTPPVIVDAPKPSLDPDDKLVTLEDMAKYLGLDGDD